MNNDDHVCVLNGLGVSRSTAGKLEHAGIETLGELKARLGGQIFGVGPKGMRELVAAMERLEAGELPDEHGSDPSPGQIALRCKELQAGWPASRWREYEAPPVEISTTSDSFYTGWAMNKEHET